jgi:hypothetical protein
MTMITYDTASAAAAEAPRKGFWARMFDRMVEAQTKRARREIELYSHLIPRELEQAGWKISDRSEDSLPFVR